MGSPLPALTESQFHERLVKATPGLLDSDPAIRALHAHYCELRRWNRRLSLVGPGAAQDVVERHYSESLAALPLISESDRSLLDVGAGAGFPGLVLAAARPILEATLVEARARKWAFLMTAVRRCGLSCRCLNVRVEKPLPEGFPENVDVITCRALTTSPELLDVLSESSPRARILVWCGAAVPRFPAGFRVGRELRLAESRSRRILEFRATNP